MGEAVLHSSEWYRAVTLNERIAALTPDRPNSGVGSERAERYIHRWREQSPFAAGSHFAQRLMMSGINEDDLRYLISEPTDALQSRVPESPAWLEQIAEAYSQPVEDDKEQLSISETIHRRQASAFLVVIEPLIKRGRNQFRQGLQEIIHQQSDVPFDTTTIENLALDHLLSQLSWMLSRTMTLELNIARISGLLDGDTSEERFQSFVSTLHDRDAALRILKEYPVLARQVILCIDQWSAFNLEVLRHLCADWGAIRTTFSPQNDPGRLVQMNRGVGDNHRNGRSVVLLGFSSGMRLVYKPRPMKVDAHFQDLLRWLNDRGDHPPFRTLDILDRNSYGWVEFVSAEGCRSVQDVRRFYVRQGGYLALLYLLEAADFHYENLIAAGEHPVLLDLEALFHPRIGRADQKHAHRLASNAFDHSVLRVGLLPQRGWSGTESEGLDLSGLGAAEGQLTPYGVPQWENASTDEMKLVRKQIATRGYKNRPTLDDAAVNPLDYVEPIVEGFTSVYRTLLEYRDELLTDDGFLARFADDETRAILRGTRTYGTLLYESFHPEVLRDALDRDRLFDRLWIQVERYPHLARLIPAEQGDLQKGDIPIFTTHPGSRDLWTSSGERIEGFFEQSGMSVVQDRMRKLNEEDLQKQIWFLQAAIATLSEDTTRVKQPASRESGPARSVDREELLAYAQAVGDRLGTLALRGDDDATWIGLTLASKGRWSLIPLGSDLYDGLSGVALFLAYLGALSDQDRYTELAHGAVTTLRRQIDQRRTSNMGIGGFDGWGGVVYALSHLSTLWDEPELLTEAEEIVEFISELVAHDEQLDVIGGAAGCIGGLKSLHYVSPSEHVLAVMTQCADRLIARAQPMEHGLGWGVPSFAENPLAGFSHGAAGVAWALMELAAITGEERYRVAALAGVEYERSLFSPEEGNWPDLREMEGPGGSNTSDRRRFMTAWCHGAAGIGLARLQMLQHSDDAGLLTEVEQALRTTLAKGFGGNHSLCHGDLGNLELVQQASTTLNDPRLDVEVNRIAANVIDSIDRDGWLCGIPLGVESPGLMTGIAGIGYGLLRLAEPTAVPSVLTLAPPAPGTSH